MLIAPHHCSKTSSTNYFVQAVGAQHAFFMVGYLNRYKHPKLLIEKRFKESGACMYLSDCHGAIKIDFLKDKPIQINALRHAKPSYWQDQYTSKY